MTLDVKKSTKTGDAKTGRPSEYDWQTWADGSWWQVSDNHLQICRFRKAAYKAAERMGKKLETEIDGETLYFRFRKQPASSGSK